MITFPNAKINLGLFVNEKRPDNYHNIETVFYPIMLSDALEVLPSKGQTRLNVTGIDIPSDNKDNLCIKAFNYMKAHYKIGELDIHLLKKIPIGSGLGGGSSDAAYTIKSISKLFNLNLSKDAMCKIASTLGSDCAFFIENKPLYAYKKGDMFESVELSLKGFYLVVVVPQLHVNTAMAYSKVKTQRNRENLKNIIALPIENWQFELYNDFEFPIFDLFPEIKTIKERLYKLGAVYASMSGSGSAVYGIFKQKVCIDNKFKNCFVWQEACSV